jgi:hypothetical protein
VTFDRSEKNALETDAVALEGLHGLDKKRFPLVGYARYVVLFPLDGSIYVLEDFFDGIGDFLANTVTWNESDLLRARCIEVVSRAVVSRGELVSQIPFDERLTDRVDTAVFCLNLYYIPYKHCYQREHTQMRTRLETFGKPAASVVADRLRQVSISGADEEKDE